MNIRHFNGTISEWNSRLNTSAYINDIVFAKTWFFDASAFNWNCNLIIYAGADQYGQEYSYNIPDFSTFIDMQKMLQLDDNNEFTNETFKDALENYIKKSEKIQEIDASINDINEEIVNINDNIINLDASVANISNHIQWND